MSNRPALGALIYFAVAFSLATYFTFAAVQGDYGVFQRAEIAVEAREYQQARDVLGLLRADEIVVR